MTCVLIFAASFISALCARLVSFRDEPMEDWWNREGIGWFVMALIFWFVVAEKMGLPMGVSEGD